MNTWGFSLVWGWSPVVFFVALVVSLVLAAVLAKGKKVDTTRKGGIKAAWVLPALVLYFGLNWGLPGWSEFVFKVIFWVTVLAVLLTAFASSGRTKFSKLPLVMMFLVVILALLLGSLETGGARLAQALGLAGGNSSQAESGDQDPDEPTDPAGDQDPESCTYGEAGFKENKSYRMLVNGLPKNNVRKAKAAAIQLAEDNTVFVAGLAMERGLKYKGMGFIDARKLIDGDGCWTEEGHELSTKVQGIVEAAKASYGVADATDINTGGKDGQLTQEAGIRGNTQTLNLTHADGSVTKILTRCGNVTFDNPMPGVPKGPTDNPRPPKKPKPPKPDNPGGGGGCPPGECNPLEEKRFSESALSNTEVDDFKGGSNGGAVNNNDGATDPRGIQRDPQGDAKKAEEKAREETKQVEQQHEEAKGGATRDDQGSSGQPTQDHGPVESPGPDW